MYYDRVRAPLLVSLTCCTGLLALTALVPQASGAAPSGGGRTIGLVVTDMRSANHITPSGEECPDGLQAGEPKQARAQKGYVELLEKYGGDYQNRGPNGEMANYNPLAVEDPLPFSELKTKISYGFNLDGTSDGRATAKTCQHEKFTSPEGEKVDNQLARVTSCTFGDRASANAESFGSTEMILSTINRRLIEISGVDDEKNDPEVEVTLYKGRDVITRTPAGDKFLPMQSHRIDPRFPQYNNVKTRGKIVDGVLITEPFASVLIPHGNAARNTEDSDFADLRMRLKLTEDGAEGLMAGYQDIAKYWNTHSKSVVAGLQKYSSPGMYRALMRYADGYPDPKTGQCTRISSSFTLRAVRALIIHKQKDQKRIAETLGQTRTERF